MPEAPPQRTEHGLLPTGEQGWYVLNAREAEWREYALGNWPRLEGAQTAFEQLGVGISVLQPGQPMTMYHWEDEQEDFLILAGEALAIVEGEERPLRQWDLLHCPRGTNHAIVGAGDGPCLVFAVGTRLAEGDWGAYTVDEAAQRHGAGVAEETTQSKVAYAPYDDPVTVRYRDGWLPE